MIYFLNSSSYFLLKNENIEIRNPEWNYVANLSWEAFEWMYKNLKKSRYNELCISIEPNIGVPDFVEVLIRRNVFVKSVEKPMPWNYWGFETQLFHYAAMHTRFLSDPIEIDLQKIGMSDAPPRVSLRDELEYTRSVCLPHEEVKSPVGEVISRRRTVRRFSSEPISGVVLSEVVSTTFGVSQYVNSGFFGELPLKGYPSSGARHEHELLVIIFNVTGIDAGIYLYDDENDNFLQLNLSYNLDDLEDLTGRQGMTHSAFMLLTICLSERIAWKYRNPRGYTDVYEDVGHALENVILHFEDYAISAWLSTAIDNNTFKRIIPVGDSRFATAVVAFGKKA
ncbi:SagB/ThcOx family dehydrogenase [Bifidobacterium sp.]|jgi:hypothetical protein|uniref:SagB/ThcOx family dehydrogenase n=1 Tax=Bifidobacterium sp. TaxID=41200 RepID=UPI0025B900EF|nr:SagB/ThcOx family dehydrogenase [Bifidobacterium sp.]MCH4208973.1 SagB/ThcOx family dehydrogenase [Bifidobacterium sp.]MCI1224944.1 SagB/ThcOx family dehydrogenase [Bifidobacterium sp.]